jgi:hypothetical protein
LLVDFSEKAPPKVKAEKSGARPWSITVNGVNIADVAVNYTDRSRTRPLDLSVGGMNISLNASAEFGAGPAKTLMDGLKVKLTDVSLSEEGKEDLPLFSLDRVLLDNSQIDISRRRIALSRIAGTGGETRVVRNKDGQIQLSELFSPSGHPGKSPKISKTGTNTKTEGKPWSFRLDAFELDRHHVNLQDHSLSPAIVYDLQDIRVLLKNMNRDSEKPMDFEVSLNVAQGGNAAFSGHLSQSADEVDADTNIKGLSLEPLRPLVNRLTYLNLKSGNVSASTYVRYRATKPAPQLNVDGSIDVDRLSLIETETNERFLEWKRMTAKKIKFGTSPQQLQSNTVRLVEPGAKILISKDKSVNLAKIVKDRDKTATGATLPSTKSTPAGSTEKQADFPVTIKKISIEKGIVDFADYSLVLPFVTRVTDFNGGIGSISSDPTSRASVKLDGKVGDFGLASVKGSLTPYAPKVFMDILVMFQNVEMTSLSPYTATFAGRKIASGTLNLNLEYKIKNSELLGNNSVVLEKFTLGERIESPGALKLPLDLAIALLTDADGKIDLAVPVRGNIDNPEFSYGRVIFKAIVNLITRVITSPFRALGGLFGDKGEPMDAISFFPGSNRLQASELKKLQDVAEALKKKPQLKLTVHGRFDPEIDGRALRIAGVLRALAEQMETEQFSSKTKLSLDVKNLAA